MPTPGRETPAIRDSSRNRLQRLGALYAGSETISSPVHKNEARFDEAELNALPANRGNRNVARSDKLAALASSINSWVDESSSGQTPQQIVDAKSDASRKKKEGAAPKRMMATTTAPKIIGSSPRREPMATKSIVRPAATTLVPSQDKAPAKQLKWDKNVMDSLEAQGFTRRESTTSKMVYDYASNDKNAIGETKNEAPKAAQATSTATSEAPPKSLASIGKGLVSGRAALFETGAKPSSSAAGSRSTTKDPAEMSLKDRLALFEKNKGTALMPKAAFGMSASQAQISSGGTAASGSSVAGNAARQNGGQRQQEQRGDDQQSSRVAPSRPVSIIQSPPVTEKPKVDAYNKPGEFYFFCILWLTL